MHITYVATKELFQALIRSKRSDNLGLLPNHPQSLPQPPAVVRLRGSLNWRGDAEQVAPAETSMGEEAVPLTSADGLPLQSRSSCGR